MKIIAFRIKNYKGIKDTTISLKGNKGSIYTLVGLNESGKTTILEAINNFSHDVDGIHAIAQKSISTDPIEALVPKKKKDNFNGDIIVAAQVRFDENDIAELNVSVANQNMIFRLILTSYPKNSGYIEYMNSRIQHTLKHVHSWGSASVH